MTVDPIADMLTRIRNANSARLEKVEVPSSRILLEIAKILYREGFIKRHEIKREGNFDMIVIYLKYGPDSEPVIQGLKRISKPGLRVYAKKDRLPRVVGGLGIAILSTSKGVMTEKEARTRGIGGEVLCYVW